MEIDIHALARAVQRNCHIADARHGANYSLCIYLLKMREYFRWERGIPLSAGIDKDEVGPWLTERETLWAELETEEPAELPLGDARIEPFEADAINARLLPLGYVYSAGLGQHAAPHFHLAELERVEEHDGFRLIISGRELARDLTAPPAMSRDGIIYIRRESLRRSIWEKVDGWSWSKPRNAMSRAIASYPVDDDLETALDQMTDDQIETVTLHEIGEVRAGELLGEAWHDCLIDLPVGKAELIARSVRDHLADCMITLPALLERADSGSLHFYMAGLSNFRKVLFPSLQQAYQDWIDTDSMDGLRDTAERGRDHWQRCCESILEHCECFDPLDSAQIEAMEKTATL